MLKLIVLFCSLFISMDSNLAFAKTAPAQASQQLFFTENKGQIKDQFGNLRNDIQFALNTSGINIFIGNDGLHYQFSKPDSDVSNKTSSVIGNNSKINTQPSATETYRMDVTLAGTNNSASIIAEEPQPYYENYYLAECPGNPLQAHTFKRITYRNIYPHIDWVIFTKGTQLEHEFVVNPGGNAADIRLTYHGASSLTINEDGSINATTPMGIIKEQPPTCYLPNGSKICAVYTLTGNTLSYDLNDYNGALVIDPVLEWGTYYGAGTSNTSFSDMVVDEATNVYACGSSSSTSSGTIATTGSYQTTIGGGSDAFIAKFDSAGNRLWGTYYGGTGSEIATGIALDHNGSVYITGNTTSNTGMTTAGTQQPVYYGGYLGSGNNGFLARFTTSGALKWGTYIGDSSTALLTTVSCDKYGHIYVSGATDDTSTIATPGSHKPIISTSASGAQTRDCFLIQYDSTGHRRWGTYYGGTDDDFGGASSNDGTYVYLSGWTFSTTGIATTAAYQPALHGSSDAFLAKFDTAGHQVWGTYYGGEGQEITGAITCKKNFVYLFGSTLSDTAMASSGCFQPARAGVEDAFIVRFDPATGMRQWGTYYGGPGKESEDNSRITADNAGNVYVTGYTTSTSGIASAGAWKTTYGGGTNDAFLAKFSGTGAQKWSTYYGGNGVDFAYSCGFDGSASYNNAVYITGCSNSTDNIATSGSFLSTGGGSVSYIQGFLAKFVDSACTLSTIPLITRTVDTLQTSTSYDYFQWVLNGTDIPGATNANYTLPVNGAYTVIVKDSNNCTATSIIDTVSHLSIDNLFGSNVPAIIVPNPTTGLIHIEGATPAKIAIFNTTGQLMNEARHTNNISMAELPAGAYFIRLYNEQGACTSQGKIFKQ